MVKIEPLGQMANVVFSACTSRGPGTSTFASCGETSDALVHAKMEGEPTLEKGVSTGHAIGTDVFKGQ